MYKKPSDSDLQRLIVPLCEWYDTHRRDLPWRKDRDAYHIWVSEIMLQQTRVEAVRPYYERFMAALPDIKTLAECPEDELLKLWEGLGYYSRVRNLQKAARQLAGSDLPEPDRLRHLPSDSKSLPDPSSDSKSLPGTSSDGGSLPHLPPDRESLLRLPGIGEYTAGAIASIAFGQAVPAVDGNVLRILARLYADERDVRKPAVKKEYTRELEAAMLSFFSGEQPITPGTFNQALMDLGALICLPNARPRCEECPLADCCRAHRDNSEMRYPVRGARKERKIENRTVLLIRDGKHVVLRKRPAKGLLAGLYEFPNVEGAADREQALAAVKEAGFVPLQIRPLEPAKHVFTHVEWHMTAYEIRIAEPENMPEKEWFLAETGRIERDFPVPSAFSAYAGYLQIRIGADGRTEQGRGRRN